MGRIGDNYSRIRAELPPAVEMVVAAKSRSAGEVAEAIAAGARIIGENYVREAEDIRRRLAPELLNGVAFHMIGHLQRNKVNKALAAFDTIQSIDSLRLARAVNKRMDGASPVPVLVQVNVAGEESKYGIKPGELHGFLECMASLNNIKVNGLMGMEPYCRDPEDARVYFRKMRELFRSASTSPIQGVEMRTLSMGMSHSHAVAVEEGANMVRIGTAIFGPRKY